VERALKTAPKGVVSCRVFAGTETYAVRSSSTSVWWP
jgi:hypothetical protein